MKNLNEISTDERAELQSLARKALKKLDGEEGGNSDTFRELANKALSNCVSQEDVDEIRALAKKSLEKLEQESSGDEM